jgi:hypothetical protein
MSTEYTCCYWAMTQIPKLPSCECLDNLGFPRHKGGGTAPYRLIAGLAGHMMMSTFLFWNTPQRLCMPMMPMDGTVEGSKAPLTRQALCGMRAENRSSAPMTSGPATVAAIPQSPSESSRGVWTGANKTLESTRGEPLHLAIALRVTSFAHANAERSRRDLGSQSAKVATRPLLGS